MDTDADSPLEFPQIELLELVAYLHLRYGDPARALSYLKLLIGLLPASARIRRSLAIAQLRLANPDQARESASQAIMLEDSEQGKAASHFVLGVASAASGLTDDAGACEEFLRIRSHLPRS